MWPEATNLQEVVNIFVETETYDRYLSTGRVFFAAVYSADEQLCNSRWIMQHGPHPPH
jgi:hypothetical protein